MGIHGLTKLLSDEAPNCMKEVTLDSLTGRKVAVDASMAMYQFLVGGLPRQLSIASHVAYNLHCSCRARPTVCGVMIGRMSPKHYCSAVAGIFTGQFMKLPRYQNNLPGSR